MNFYRCDDCGVIALKLVDGKGELNCCNKPMRLLEAGVTDAAVEKHVPALKLEGTKLMVEVGDVIHPMTDDHYIQFVAVVQGDTVQHTALTSDMEPKASFDVRPGEPITVYEYCNLHGLWKAEIN